MASTTESRGSRTGWHAVTLLPPAIPPPLRWRPRVRAESRVQRTHNPRVGGSSPSSGMQSAYKTVALPVSGLPNPRSRPRDCPLRGPRHRPGVAQPADLGVAESEHVGEDLLGVLAEHGRPPGGQAPGSDEVERRGRDEVAPDPGLLERGEHRVLLGSARVLLHELAEGLVRAPRDAAVGEGGADRVERAGLEPRPEDRGDQVAGAEAAVLGGEVVAGDALEALEGRRRPGHL